MGTIYGSGKNIVKKGVITSMDKFQKKYFGYPDDPELPEKLSSQIDEAQKRDPGFYKFIYTVFLYQKRSLFYFKKNNNNYFAWAWNNIKQLYSFDSDIISDYFSFYCIRYFRIQNTHF